MCISMPTRMPTPVRTRMPTRTKAPMGRHRIADADADADAGADADDTGDADADADGTGDDTGASDDQAHRIPVTHTGETDTGMVDTGSGDPVDEPATCEDVDVYDQTTLQRPARPRRHEDGDDLMSFAGRSEIRMT